MAVALSMALHELATNAAKYGALSVPSGHLDVSWRADGAPGNRRLHLRWIETGGPRVQKPVQRGFGSKLLERIIADQLDGELHFAFEPDGVRCEMTVPLGLD
ncbi:MAG TPA: sensor histidine kinase [Alphaproteobacteria bacterium]|nr:sensor histidine kinase [Alphaproteobacteria bacterium]